MSRREPTPEQAAAIQVEGRDVLLEAGAGTGKTGVMVDRYCRLVCEEGVEPDAILAFTFTDKAAAELRHRIRAELSRRAEEGSERAGSLLSAIGAAWVTTIHGFCNRLLAAHPVAAGIDPGFRVLDTPEFERLAREAFESALGQFLAQGGEEREETLATFEIDALRQTVISAYVALRSRGAPASRLPEPPERDAEEAIRHAAEAAAATLEELRPTDSKRALLERAAEVLGGPGPSPSLDELCSLGTTSKAKAMVAYRGAIEAAIARSAEAGEGGVAYRHLSELLELFAAALGTAKGRRGGLDFEDLQVLATQLLERTEIGEAYRSRFSHVLVDEFQDTNRLQLRLIEALRGPGSTLVAVGDELQSIYSFRNADLDVFREQRALMEQRADAETMELSGNFRSRPEVIGAVNTLGAALLGEAFRPLRVGAEPQSEAPAGEGPAVELLLTARDGWDAEGIELEPTIDGRTPLNCLAEARFVAARLRELAENGIKRSEMVVLLRAYSHLDAYEDSLARAGLRPYVVGGRGYWSQQQVSDVCALLATIANPLDDQALFGALASPACGAAPDTLWLLRAAAGKRRHVWPALAVAAGAGETELDEPERLAQIPDGERELLRSFAATLEGLRERASRLPLNALVEAAISETGYDLAVLMRPAGEARLANVRKLQRLAAEYEAREGRDLRGLLDFLAARGESPEAPAATAAEGHDGVRVMTVHNAKGLEFGVVAVPDLSRNLLSGGRSPMLTLGREEPPRIGMRMLRLGAAPIDLFDYAALCEEERQRAAEEELRLFHVAATRARERLILSGVVKPEPGATKVGTQVIERIVNALEAPRDEDSSATIEAPRPRPGLEADFETSQIAVRVNLPSPERAAELTATPPAAAAAADLAADGAPPLVKRRPPTVPSRPLSYTAISAFHDCPYRFYMERVLGLGQRPSSRLQGGAAVPGGLEGLVDDDSMPTAREERSAHGAAVHALLEWSKDHGWSEPSAELARSHASAAGLDPDREGLADALLEPVRGWLGSALLRERIGSDGAVVRAEAPILLGVGGAVLRGSIDLLVEREGEPPLVIDYKTDRLGGDEPAARAAHYETQRGIYALAVAESRQAAEIEVAYVFLQRPEEPVLFRLDAGDLADARVGLADAISRIGAGEFHPAPPDRRNWGLCRGCPALGRLCSGPPEES